RLFEAMSCFEGPSPAAAFFAAVFFADTGTLLSFVAVDVSRARLATGHLSLRGGQRGPRGDFAHGVRSGAAQRELAGLTALPSSWTSKWRWQPVEEPVVPT